MDDQTKNNNKKCIGNPLSLTANWNQVEGSTTQLLLEDNLLGSRTLYNINQLGLLETKPHSLGAIEVDPESGLVGSSRGTWVGPPKGLSCEEILNNEAMKHLKNVFKTLILCKKLFEVKSV